MNVLTKIEDINYFSTILGKEPTVSVALDFENGGCYERADFGPIGSDQIEVTSGGSWEGSGYLVVAGVRVAKLTWGLQVQFTAWPL